MSHLLGRRSLKRIANNLSVVIGIVLIWRGIWHLLDNVDVHFLGGDQILTAVGGIVLGFLILYIPDGDVDELGAL